MRPDQCPLSTTAQDGNDGVGITWGSERASQGHDNSRGIEVDLRNLTTLEVSFLLRGQPYPRALGYEGVGRRPLDYLVAQYTSCLSRASPEEEELDDSILVLLLAAGAGHLHVPRALP